MSDRNENSPVVIVSFGGGVNSAALLVGMQERGMKCDAILFADTGGEKPHTYQFVEIMEKWLVKHGFPSITRVRASQRTYKDLEDNCLKQNMLPSLAYGFKSCSHKYKKQPQEVWANNWQPAKDVWAAGDKVTKYLGIDIGEERRAKIPEDDKYRYEYPLLRWEWAREDCLEALERGGLPNPGKSACFFCPGSKKHEIRQLQNQYPELAQRAIEMERNAELTSVKGLGRSFSWESYLKADAAQGRLFPEVLDTGCLCYDGEEDPPDEE